MVDWHQSLTVASERNRIWQRLAVRLTVASERNRIWKRLGVEMDWHHNLTVAGERNRIRKRLAVRLGVDLVSERANTAELAVAAPEELAQLGGGGHFTLERNRNWRQAVELGMDWHENFMLERNRI